jgi:hypothetical protein
MGAAKLAGAWSLRNRPRMSGSGTDRLCWPVRELFRCWRLTGGAVVVPGPSRFDPERTIRLAAPPKETNSLAEREGSELAVPL